MQASPSKNMHVEPHQLLRGAESKMICVFSIPFNVVSSVYVCMHVCRVSKSEGDVRLPVCFQYLLTRSQVCTYAYMLYVKCQNLEVTYVLYVLCLRACTHCACIVTGSTCLPIGIHAHMCSHTCVVTSLPTDM